MKITEIGNVQNYYGGIQVYEDGGKFYWGIENHSDTQYKEIPESLYRALMDYENSRNG